MPRFRRSAERSGAGTTPVEGRSRGRAAEHRGHGIGANVDARGPNGGGAERVVLGCTSTPCSKGNDAAHAKATRFQDLEEEDMKGGLAVMLTLETASARRRASDVNSSSKGR